MKKLPNLLNEKADKAELYSNELAGIDWLAYNVPDGYTHGWQAYVCQVSSEKDPEGFATSSWIIYRRKD